MFCHGYTIFFINLCSRHFGNRHFGTVDIMGIDILGIDILASTYPMVGYNNSIPLAKFGRSPCTGRQIMMYLKFPFATTCLLVTCCYSVPLGVILLITFPNSSNQDQARQLLLKEFFNEKNQQMTKKHAKLPCRQRVKSW